MNSNNLQKDHQNFDSINLLERMKAECLQAILSGYEEAQISGLCHEGALEMAVGRLRSLKPEQLLAEWKTEVTK